MSLAITAGYLLYFLGGYFSARYIWDEDVLALLAGKNYVEQNLIPLLLLYLVGEVMTFIAWPLIAPTILIWRGIKK